MRKVKNSSFAGFSVVDRPEAKNFRHGLIALDGLARSSYQLNTLLLNTPKKTSRLRRSTV